MQPVIETVHLYKRFGTITALDDVNIAVARGEFVAIMGSSGSGKTTLMNILSCLDTPTEGKVLLNGTDAAALDEEARRAFRARTIGLVFQQFHLLPYLTACENVMLAQYYHSVTDKAAALAALERVGLAHRSDHLPKQLSGGEQQRLSLARALIARPQILYLDEATNQLDDAAASALIRTLQAALPDCLCLAISHQPAIKALFPQQLDLNRYRATALYSHPPKVSDKARR